MAATALPAGAQSASSLESRFREMPNEYRLRMHWYVFGPAWTAAAGAYSHRRMSLKNKSRTSGLPRLLSDECESKSPEADPLAPVARRLPFAPIACRLPFASIARRLPLASIAR
jgi:hypothetical protein